MYKVWCLLCRLTGDAPGHVHTIEDIIRETDRYFVFKHWCVLVLEFLGMVGVILVAVWLAGVLR